VQGDNHILEEDDVLVTKRHSEARNNGGQNIEQLCSTVEFVGLVNEGEEALIDRLTDHLASGHQLSVELVQNILEVITFDGLLRIKKLKEVLNELGSDVYLEGADFDRLMDNQL